MTTVRYFFQDEEEPEASFFVRERHLTLRQLRKAFPFQGRFHFRARRRAPAPASAPASYVWLDLVAEDDVVPHGGGVITLKVLSQPFRHLADDELMDEEKNELDEPPLAPPDTLRANSRTTISNAIDSAAEDARRHIESARNAAAKVGAKMGAGLSSFWKRASAAANTMIGDAESNDGSGGGGGGGGSSRAGNASGGRAAASARAMEVLDGLGRDLADGEATAAAKAMQGGAAAPPGGEDALARARLLLVEMWGVCGAALHQHPDDPTEAAAPAFRAQGADWRSLGFASDDPVASLRGGVLPLRCLGYFATEYPRAARAIVANHCTEHGRRAAAGAGGCCYPLGAVAINVTLMLAELTLIRNQRYAAASADEFPFWRLFEHREAFFELFCLSLRLLDATWEELNPPEAEKRAAFASVIERTKDRVAELLRTRPGTLEELYDSAGRLGVLV